MVKRRLRPTLALVALRFFGDRSLVTEDKVAKEGAQGDCDHDPSIISHEDQPAVVSAQDAERERNGDGDGATHINMNA